MKIRLIALLSSLALSSVAFADNGPGSGALHNTAGGKLEVTPAIAYTTFDKKLDTNGAPIEGWKGTGLAEQLKVEYGINSMTSIGLNLINYSYSTKGQPSGVLGIADFKDEGLMDPQIYVHNRMDMG